MLHNVVIGGTGVDTRSGHHSQDVLHIFVSIINVGCGWLVWLMHV